MKTEHIEPVLDLVQPGVIAAIANRVPTPNIDKGLSALEEANAIQTVASIDDEKRAGVIVNRMGAIIADYIAHYKPYADAARNLHIAITGNRQAAIAPHRHESDRLQKLVLDRRAQVERERLAEQRRVSEQMDRERRAEYEREQQAALERAAKLEDAGREQEAQDLLTRAVHAEPPTPIKVVLPDKKPSAKDAGGYEVTNYDFEVDNTEAVVRACFKLVAPWEFLTTNRAVILAAVKAQKDLFRCPGIRVVKTKSWRRSGKLNT